MTLTALAADEPEPLRAGGFIPAGTPLHIGGDGCFFPAGLRFPVDTATTDTAGNVSVTFTIPDGPLAESLRDAIGRGYWSIVVPDEP